MINCQITSPWCHIRSAGWSVQTNGTRIVERSELFCFDINKKKHTMWVVVVTELEVEWVFGLEVPTLWKQSSCYEWCTSPLSFGVDRPMWTWKWSSSRDLKQLDSIKMLSLIDYEWNHSWFRQGILQHKQNYYIMRPDFSSNRKRRRR